jgi:YidC/Oxa1 family membrane protein insertase
MDKKNLFLGLIFLGAAFASMFYSSRRAAPAQPAPELTNTAPGPLPTPVQALPPDTSFAAAAATDGTGNIVTLSNEFADFRFTDQGGALLDVALRQYTAERGGTEPYVINRIHADPALAIVDFPGLDRSTRYELVSRTDREVVYRTTIMDGRLEVLRRHRLAEEGDPTGDPYQIRHETILRNLSTEVIPLPRISMSVATAAPLNAQDAGLYLTTGYNQAGDTTFLRRSKLEGGGFLAAIGIGSSAPLPAIDTAGPLLWTAVNNQFFTCILTPDTPVSALTTRRVKLDPLLDDTDRRAYGLVGIARFDVPAIAPGAESTIGGGFYAGPKEYTRLANANVFQADESEVMQFGWLIFRWCAQILQWTMKLFHTLTGNWGVSIILSTLLLKVIFLYPTLSASKSAKRLQKVQPEFAALREKYKDNPRKMQVETMELYKKHGVNPLGSCLPILITMPFFIGFFRMLQSTAELRFASFLWTSDLSAPDTIARVFGMPLNILPLLMGATMIIQMRLTPMVTTDKAQQTMFRLMPWVFTLFCYNFSAALSLYSSINGLFTIGQQLIVNRMADPLPKATATPAKPGGRPVKNVTPKKKKG